MFRRPGPTPLSGTSLASTVVQSGSAHAEESDGRLGAWADVTARSESAMSGFLDDVAAAATGDVGVSADVTEPDDGTRP